MFKKRLVLETDNFILTKRFWKYKLKDKNKKYKFQVISWFHCNSLGAIAGYSIWRYGGATYSSNGKWGRWDKEITPRKNNPKTEKELVEFIKGIKYEEL